MKYALYIVDVFSPTVFGGNQLAILPDARGLSEGGMQRIAREFNFAETTFVLPPSDAANSCRLRIFTPSNELPFAGHPTVGTACALVHMWRASAGATLRLEEEIGVVPVEVRAGGAALHGTLRLRTTVAEAKGPPDARLVASLLSLEESDVLDCFFASAGLPFCFVHLKTARICAPTLGIAEDPATGSACAALVGALANRAHDASGEFSLSIVQGVAMGRRSEIAARARKEYDKVTSVSVGGETSYVAAGEIEVPAEYVTS